MRRFLSSRERSVSEVYEYIRKKSLGSREDAARVVEFLLEEGTLDDRRFASNRSQYRVSKSYGPLYIRQELGRLKIDPDTGISEEEYLEKALEAAEKKLPGMMKKPDAEIRLYRFLQSRGYTGDQIRKTMKSLKTKYPHWARRTSATELEEES